MTGFLKKLGAAGDTESLNEFIKKCKKMLNDRTSPGHPARGAWRVRRPYRHPERADGSTVRPRPVLYLKSSRLPPGESLRGSFSRDHRHVISLRLPCWEPGRLYEKAFLPSMLSDVSQTSLLDRPDNNDKYVVVYTEL